MVDEPAVFYKGLIDQAERHLKQRGEYVWSFEFQNVVDGHLQLFVGKLDVVLGEVAEECSNIFAV